GLSPMIDSIIEIAAVKVTSEGESHFSELVNPGIMIPEYTIGIHGITDEMVAESRDVEEVMRDFLEFCGDLPMVAHNARFDLGYLVFDMHCHELKFPKSPVYCTCLMSRQVFKEMPNHKLATLAEQLGIPLVNHHRALADAEACKKIFAKGLLRDADGLKHGYLFSIPDFDPEERDFTIPDHLAPIIDLLPTQEVIDILYKGGSYKNQWRPFRPVSFIPLPAGDFLYGQCLHSGIYKTFLLSKVKDFRKLTEDQRLKRLAIIDNLAR
ncbi:MAG: 3'-5' exonuclease, partial [Halobacteriovoraceae bacterium]|nr:3'-5' exonuclease [Halobacteriovoraceae bacterium]